MELLFTFIWVIIYYNAVKYVITVYMIQTFWNTYNAVILG